MGDILLPILKDNKDPHYRYKMPKLTAKVEGSGNGIKTVITNMTAVARALGRPASYTTKYFGCELGAQVTMNNEYIVNGSHDADRLLNLLYGFIRKFVLCTKCNNPETNLTIVGGNIRQKCMACGYDHTIPKTIHKLTTFIINHPPNGTSNGTNGSSSTNSTKGSKGTKSSKKSKNSSNGSSSPNRASDENLENIGQGKEENNGNDFDDDFGEDDLTPEAYTKRMRELCSGLNNGLYISDPKEKVNLFFKIAKEKKDQLHEASVQRELVKEADQLGMKEKATLVLCEILFTENILDEIEKNKVLLWRFCNENPKAQKYLLGGFEKLVGEVFKDKLFNNSMKILKKFYDEEILDEEVILEWAGKESKKYVSKEMSKKIHEKVAPFIKWLKEAEVEDDDSDDNSSDQSDSKQNQTNNKQQNKPSTNGQQQQTRKQSLEDEEDDGIDLEFSHRVSGIEVVENKVPAKPINADLVATPVLSNSEHAEDDIDIDNI